MPPQSVGTKQSVSYIRIDKSISSDKLAEDNDDFIVDERNTGVSLSSLSSYPEHVVDTLRRSFKSLESCPRELYVNFILKFFESYSYFAISQILVLYLHTEFSVGDVEAGTAYGIWGLAITLWGLSTAWINDNLGVRNSLLVGFLVSAISYLILATATTKLLLYLTLFGILPLGNSMGIPMLTVGVRRYTDVTNRGFAFGLFYSVMNISAFISGFVVDFFNISIGDEGFDVCGYNWSGNRLVILSAVFTSTISWFITYVHLREIRVTDSAPCTPSSPPSFPHSSPVPTAEADYESYPSNSISPIYGNGNDVVKLIGKGRRTNKENWKNEEHDASGIEFSKLLSTTKNVLQESSFDVEENPSYTLDSNFGMVMQDYSLNIDNFADFSTKKEIEVGNEIRIKESNCRNGERSMKNIPGEYSSSNSPQKHPSEKSAFSYKEKEPYFLEFEETPQSSRHPSDADPVQRVLDLKIPNLTEGPQSISVLKNIRINYNDDYGGNNIINNDNDDDNNDNRNDNNEIMTTNGIDNNDKSVCNSRHSHGYHLSDENDDDKNDAMNAIQFNHFNSNTNKSNNSDNDNNDDDFNIIVSDNHKSNTEIFVIKTQSPWNIILDLVKSRTFWRFSAFTLILINLKAIFRHLDATLPTYLVRTFGPSVPKGIIYSINPFIIIFLTPLVSALTGSFAHYDMIKWGSYLTAASPFFLAFSTSIWASICMVVVLSFGEAIWSPRTYDYTMSIAPEGREASFAAMASAPIFAAKIPVGLMSGYLVARYLPETGPQNGQMLWLIIALFTLTSPIGITAFESCIREPSPSPPPCLPPSSHFLADPDQLTDTSLEKV